MKCSLMSDLDRWKDYTFFQCSSQWRQIDSILSHMYSNIRCNDSNMVQKS